MRSERVDRFGAAAPLARISSIIHRDPNLNTEGMVALDEMIKATYARLRTDKNPSGD